MICNNIVVYNTDAQLSDYFKCHEFTSAERGITFIDPKLIWILDAIRRRTDAPLYVIEGNDGSTDLHYCGMAATVESDSVSDSGIMSMALDIVPAGHAKIVTGGVMIDSNY